MATSTTTTAHRANSAAPPAIRLGLQRITSLLGGLGNPHLNFAVIQVAGTNGKGTTGAYLDYLLRHALASGTEAQPTVGRFNSPHLIEPRDSAVVNGKPIDLFIWQAAGQKVDAAVLSHGVNASPFEKLFARAMLSFSLLPPTTRPKVLVLEAGLGFQDDATNVFPATNVLAGVLTQVASDHEALLGSTLDQITRNKAHVFPAYGLGIVADQRRPGDAGAPEYGTEASDDRAAENASALPANLVAGVGESEYAVLNAVRSRALESESRLARAYIPSCTLTASDVKFVPALDAALIERDKPSWEQPLARVAVRYSPTLFASRGMAGTGFAARRGETVNPGPVVEVPATAAHVAGISTALQTLWSVARDEPASASVGGPGTDAYEDIRMRVAMFLGMAGADARVSAAAQQMVWPGRTDWLSISVPTIPHTFEYFDPPDGQGGEFKASTRVATAPRQLTALVDGAHNPASAKALRSYLSLCLTGCTRPVRIMWIMGFTAGKDVSGMLSTLFGSQGDLADEMGKMSLLDPNVTHRVAFVPFSTPEGMDWIRCMSPDEAQEAAARTPGISLDSEAYRSLSEALDAASEDQLWLDPNGEPFDPLGPLTLTVVCGSLYLVSDLYRWIQAHAATTVAHS